MEQVSVTLDDLAAQLGAHPLVSYRMVLVRRDDAWHLGHVAIDACPTLPQPGWNVYEYPKAVFLAGHIPGVQVAEWLSRQEGQVASFRFRLQELTSPVYGTHVPSLARYGLSSLAWPHRHYELNSRASNLQPLAQTVLGYLVAEGCPFYPDFVTAALHLLYDVTDLTGRSSIDFPSRTGSIRIADDSAWVQHLKLGPASLTATVAGRDVGNTRLDVFGQSPALQRSIRLQGTGPATIALPDGVPAVLWVVLARSERWLDYRYVDQRQPWATLDTRHGGIEVESPDPSTVVAARIADGEGLTTEFKVSLPDDRQRFLKTISAFANAIGGWLLVGVNDEGTVLGFDGDPAEVRDSIVNMVRDNITPEPTIEVRAAEIDGRTLLVVQVQPGADKPYGVLKKSGHPEFYVRRGASTFPARRDEIVALCRSGDEG